MGLRKFKSDKDLRGKLRKARASEEGSRAASHHQRLPSIPPVLPLPAHIAQSLAITTTASSSSSSSKSVQSSGTSSHSSTARPSTRSTSRNASHRRSRSFSTLTSVLSPTSSTFDQPWRSREAWLAIHSRTPSPPPTTALPTAPGGVIGGWRRKGNGGFFARELAGVGDTTLDVPAIAGRPGLGSGRARTMNDLAGELDRPEPTRQTSEPVIEHYPPTALEPQAIRVEELQEWKPGFATYLYRQKTRRISLRDTPAIPPAEEVITPPPPSRPESRTLPDCSPPQVSRRQRSDTNTSSGAVCAGIVSRVDSTRTNTTDSACSMTVSIRTSQSSSIHTYENDEAEMYASGLTKDSADVPESPDTSPLGPRERGLPTIVTPTSTHYHSGSGRSADGEPMPRNAIREHAEVQKEETYLPYRDRHHDSAFGPYPPHVLPAQRASSRIPHFKHTRDESLPPLLPPAPIERARPSLTDPNSPRIGRMGNLPWAQASQQGDKHKMNAGRTPSAQTRRVIMGPRGDMGQVREVDNEGEIALVPGLRASRSSDMTQSTRWSKGSTRSRESEARRGGWV